MKRITVTVILSAFVFTLSFSQSDTTYKYYTKTGNETTKDSAYSYAKMYKHDNLWHRTAYYIKGGFLQYDGDYVDMNYEKPTGTFKNYKEDGKLDHISNYADGRATEKTYYYKNGAKKSWITYNDKGVAQQKGWDESGEEIKKFIVEREARFKGGMEGWKRYLERKLNANVAADAGAPEGNYEVKLQFIIDKEGLVSNVKAINIPAKCKPCAVEAIRVVSDGPQWEPAVQNNEPVIYQAIQYLTFQVINDIKKEKISLAVLSLETFVL